MQQKTRFQTLVEKRHLHVQHMESATLLEKLPVQNFVLIDVREREEFEKGHIPGAIHVSKGVLEVQIERVVPNPEAEIVLYCGGGSRSTLAAFNLQEMGYTQVKSLIGGAKDWQAKGLAWEI